MSKIYEALLRAEQQRQSAPTDSVALVDVHEDDPVSSRTHSVAPARASIPPSDRPRRRKQPFTPDPEVVSLVHQVFLARRDPPLGMVVFSGVEHGVGCSRIAAGTAAMLASGGDLVCLVEANFNSPSLSQLFGVESGPGLAAAIGSSTPILNYAKPVSDDERLWLLPAGLADSNAPGLLGASRLRTRLEELQDEFAFVIVDAPPVHCAETLTLGRLSSGVVLVLEADRTRRDTTAAAAGMLRSSEIELLGAVLNKRTYPIPDRIYARL